MPKLRATPEMESNETPRMNIRHTDSGEATLVSSAPKTASMSDVSSGAATRPVPTATDMVRLWIEQI